MPKYQIHCKGKWTGKEERGTKTYTLQEAQRIVKKLNHKYELFHYWVEPVKKI